MAEGSKYEQSFGEALGKLNPAQREAVNAIEGPVLVIAGPGTGKTQILASRIGKILQDTDAPAHSILCLTYTDTGRVEMRNRLFKLIGPDAYRVNIHTFHSFCNEVIQDNLYYFGSQSLEAISDLEEMQLYEKLLKELPPDNPLKIFKEESIGVIRQLKNFYTLFKKQAWSISYVNQCIDDYIKELPSKEGFVYKKKYKQFKAGDPKEAQIKYEIQRMERLKAAVNLYPLYQAEMKELSRYTFDDMILWVLDKFTENKELLLNYQERFLYFLVDEFQDTSRSQNLLLDYLVRYWEDSPNIFVVGDDDQSIYSFQDANVENIRKFEKQYENHLRKVMLVENYRSTQAILDWAKKLIEHNKERLVEGKEKELKAVNPSRQELNIQPEINEYSSVAEETIDTGHTIATLVKNGVLPKDIAVIYRNHAQADELERYFMKKGIPVNMKRNMNLLEQPLIKKILTLMRYIVEENDTPYSGDELLFELLHFDFFQLSPLEIAKISVEVSRKRFSEKRSEKYSIRRYIAELPEQSTPDLFNPSRQTDIKRISLLLEDLIGKMRNETLQVLFEELIYKTGILKCIIDSPEKTWLLETVNAFFNFIKNETRKKTSLTLPELLKMISVMNKYGLRLEIQKISAMEHGVNLMTAHGSKGTEYEYVFLIGCHENAWGQKKTSGRNNFKLPDNLSGKVVNTDDAEESRRLFYVALTRAKTHLEVSYYRADDKNKPLSPSLFIGELTEGTGIIPTKKIPDANERDDYFIEQFSAGEQPDIELIDKNYADHLLKNYALSVTHLNSYLDCPLRFYYQHLIRVPAAKNAAIAFGTVIHDTLRELFRKMSSNNNIFPSKETMLEDFRRFMFGNRESFTAEQFKRRTEYGEKILPPYYSHYINKWNKIVTVEINIRNVEVNGVPVKGQLDKLEFDGKKVNIVDYKTGNYENARPKLKPPGETNPAGGDYWRQAVFYKILVDNDKKHDWNAVSAEFDFVEPVKDEYKAEKIIIAREDIAQVTEQITDTWNKIQNHEFSKGCGKEDCHWCNFVKDNKMYVAPHQLADREQ